uniref:DUF19 domain-containing protein n=1 Tax=Rhabditophanes sp. KR3021 TaxID=114890 RepID=A0AC35TXX8_9BILA
MFKKGVLLLVIAVVGICDGCENDMFNVVRNCYDKYLVMFNLEVNGYGQLPNTAKFGRKIGYFESSHSADAHSQMCNNTMNLKNCLGESESCVTIENLGNIFNLTAATSIDYFIYYHTQNYLCSVINDYSDSDKECLSLFYTYSAGELKACQDNFQINLGNQEDCATFKTNFKCSQLAAEASCGAKGGTFDCEFNNSYLKHLKSEICVFELNNCTEA